MKKETILAATVLLLGSGGASTAEASSPERLSLELAREVAGAALETCVSEGQRVTVAVVDRDGSTRVLLKADGAGPHTVGSSTGKAFTSASLGRDTASLASAIAANPELEGLRDMDPRLVILAGGVPIRIGGQLLGGIGVGGAPSGAIDEGCARAGLAAVGAGEEGED